MVLRLRPEARLDLEAAVRWYEAQDNGLPCGLSEHPPCTDTALALRRGLPTHSRTGHHRCSGRSALRPRPQALAEALQHLSALAPNPLRHFRAPARHHREAHAHQPRLPAPDAHRAPGPWICQATASPAPAQDIARRILGEDVTQIDYYTERVKRMVGKVLTFNDITRYERGTCDLVWWAA